MLNLTRSSTPTAAQLVNQVVKNHHIAMSEEEKKPTKHVVWHAAGAGKSSSLYSKVLVDLLLERSSPSLYWNLANLFPRGTAERKKSLEEEKHALVKQLLESDIDPVAFDVLLSNEINRRLKVRFGVAFLVLTFLFTVASYAIVACDGIFKWGIAEIAITALIIETPIQFVGLLYIIARNLFPNTAQDETKQLNGKFTRAPQEE